MYQNYRHRQNALKGRGLPCLIALLLFALAFSPAFAVGEDEETADADAAETEESYTPSEYRLANSNINEWEDRVLIAATGRLTNEGRVYYAYGDYVDELISYFVKDDLDLSEADAKDAIAQIEDPQNAKAGAQSGYLYQIGGKPKDSDSLIEDGEYDGEIYPEFDGSVRFANEGEYRNSDLYLNNKAFIEDRTGTVYESKSAMRKEMKQLAASDRTYKKLLSERPEGAAVTELTMPKGLSVLYMVLGAVMLLLTAVVIVNAWRTGAVSAFRGLDDESWTLKTSAKRRRRTRRTSAVILAVTVAIDLAMIFAGLTYNSTFGSDGYIEDAMDRGGICQHGYMDFRDDVHGLLTENSLPQNSLDLALTYRDYRFDYIKGIRSAMKNGSDDVAYRGIQESVEAQIDLMAYVAKKDSSNVVSGVSRLFEDSMSTDIGVFVYKLRKSMKPFCLIGFVLYLISLVLAALMMVVERRDVYHGIRDLAFGVLGGTVLWGIALACAAFIYDPAAAGLAGDGVYVMYRMAMEGAPHVMLVLLIISAAAAAVLFATSAYMRRRSR